MNFDCSIVAYDIVLYCSMFEPFQIICCSDFTYLLIVGLLTLSLSRYIQVASLVFFIICPSRYCSDCGFLLIYHSLFVKNLPHAGFKYIYGKLIIQVGPVRFWHAKYCHSLFSLLLDFLELLDRLGLYYHFGHVTRPPTPFWWNALSMVCSIFHQQIHNLL